MTKGTFHVATWVSCKWFPFSRIDITDQGQLRYHFHLPKGRLSMYPSLGKDTYLTR